MKYPKIMLAFLLAIASGGVWAQAPFPQPMKKQMTREEMSAQPEMYPSTNFPYSSQANFTIMETTDIQNIEKTSSPGYIGIVGEKWETEKRGRRSTFIHDGQEISVGYDLLKNEPGQKNQTILPILPSSVPNSLPGRKSNLP